MTTTNLGRIGFVPKGNYSAGTYKFLDVVRYNGSAYACQVATTTNNPSNTTDWMLLNSDGTNGSNGTNGTNGTNGQVFSYVGTWENVSRPTSLPNVYTDRMFITNVGVGGSEWYWDGSRFRAVGGQVVLYHQGADISMPTSEAILISKTIPAGVIQAYDEFVISLSATKVITTNAAFSLTARIVAGATAAVGNQTLNANALRSLNSSNSNTFIFDNFVLKRTSATQVKLLSAYGFDSATTMTDTPSTVPSLDAETTLSVSGVCLSGCVGTLINSAIILRTCG